MVDTSASEFTFMDDYFTKKYPIDVKTFTRNWWDFIDWIEYGLDK
jgi:hypothetical protein